MTKAELIRKIAKRAGVPDSEAKIFFEIFLKKSSELLSPGETIFLKGFGHFQLRKGKIRAKFSQKEIPSEESIYVDLMVYYPAKILENEFEQNLIFNVPALQLENYNVIDSHFSLSIGKPVIPLKGVKGTDFFIPLTGLELRKLVEAKVDKILNEIEIVKEYTKGNEVLVIDAESFKSHQLEFNWGEVPSKNIAGSKISSKKDVKKPDEINGSKIAWDFGYDLSKEIEEESILDVEKETEEPESEDRNIGWDLGITLIEEESEINPEEPEEIPELIEEDEIHAENIKEKESEKESKIKREEKFESDKDDDFEMVRTISSTLMGIEENTEELKFENDINEVDWGFGSKTTVSYDEFEPDTQISEPVEEETEPIKESNKTVQFENTEPQLESVSEDDEISTIETKQEEEEKTVKGSSAATSSVLERRLARESRYSRRGVSSAFVIALIVIIAVAVILSMYLSGAFENKKETAIIGPPTKKLNASVIERDYSIPVSYPYRNDNEGTNSVPESNIQSDQKSKSGEISKDKLSNNKISPKSAKTNLPTTDKNGFNSVSKVPPKTPEGNIKKDNGSNISFDNLPPPVDIEQVRKNITKVGSTYTAQISSWQNKSIAQDQVAKYISKGYDAYMEQAKIPGKGTWYRVKIKNFKSMKEAEDFLIENL